MNAQTRLLEAADHGAEHLTPYDTLPVPVIEKTDGDLTRLAIREAGRTYFVMVDAIHWIEGADYYVKLHIEGRTHLLRETMRSLEERLSPRRFARVHRSAIVNLARIREIRIAGKGDHVIVLGDSTRLRLSRARRRHLEQLMEHAPV
jgi:two-component system LytT family response regulator